MLLDLIRGSGAMPLVGVTKFLSCVEPEDPDPAPLRTSSNEERINQRRRYTTVRGYAPSRVILSVRVVIRIQPKSQLKVYLVLI